MFKCKDISTKHALDLPSSSKASSAILTDPHIAGHSNPLSF